MRTLNEYCLHVDNQLVDGHRPHILPLYGINDKDFTHISQNLHSVPPGSVSIDLGTGRIGGSGFYL